MPKITKHHHSKVMKAILTSRTPFTTQITIDNSFYTRCGLPSHLVEACLNALASDEYIELIPPACSSYPSIIIKQKAYTYFPDKRHNDFRFWVPVCISITALIISILALLKP